MKIPCKMEIQILHRHHLRIAAAGRAALDAKAWPERGLPQGDDSLFPESGKSLPQSHGDRGLSLPGGSRVDSRHKDQPSLRILLDLLYVSFRKLRLIPAVNLQILLSDSDPLRHLRDRGKLRRLGDLNICFHVTFPSL